MSVDGRRGLSLLATVGVAATFLASHVVAFVGGLQLLLTVVTVLGIHAIRGVA